MKRRVAEVGLIASALRTPAEQLAGILVATVYYQHYDRTATLAFQREVTRFRDDDVMEHVKALRAEFMHPVVDVIERGVADGSFRDVDPAVAAMAVLSFGFWAWTWYEPDDQRPPEVIAAQLVRLHQGGLVRDVGTVPDTEQLDDYIAPLVRRILESFET